MTIIFIIIMGIGTVKYNCGLDNGTIKLSI